MQHFQLDSKRKLALWAVLVSALVAPTGADEMCGNLDGDDWVDQPDLGILLSDYGCDGGGCPGDVDGDGDTDRTDLAWWIIGHLMYWDGLQQPCAPYGTGGLDLQFVAVDNTQVGLGDDAIAPAFNGGVTHFTFDLRAEVGADNDWTTQRSSIELIGEDLAFFNHPYGGDTEPSEALLPYFPALEFDSFYAAPPELFDNYPMCIEAPDWADERVEALWFKWWYYEGFDYDYLATTQRFTVVLPEDSGAVPAAMPDDCTHDYAILARIETDATSMATGADLLYRKYLIVDLAQPTCRGDVDMDGDVDQSDLGAMLASYNRPNDDPLYDEQADFDCDGDVDQADLGTLLAAYGGDC